MSEKKDKLRKIASGERQAPKGQTRSGGNNMTRYALAEQYQKSEGKSRKPGLTYSATRVTVGTNRYSSTDRGMTPTIWKSHITSRGASPALGRAENFSFGGQVYSVTETTRDGSPLPIVR